MSDFKALGLIIIAAAIVWVAWLGTNAITQYLATLS